MKQTQSVLKFLRCTVCVLFCILLLPMSNVIQVSSMTNEDDNTANVLHLSESEEPTLEEGPSESIPPSETEVPVETQIPEETVVPPTDIPTESVPPTEVTDPPEYSTEYIPVTDIVISDFEDVIEVDKTVMLSVTIIPGNATEQTVRYSSSKPSVATVSPTGEIKGISAGKTTITLSCGDVKKKFQITVKVSAKLIEVNESYIVLREGETFQLTATVFPENASDQTIEYESINSEVASISKKGLVTANGVGNTIIILKNKDVVAAITVIVNNNEPTPSNTEPQNAEIQQIEIANTMTVSQCPVIDTDLLRYLYKNNEQLSIEGKNYTLKIQGRSIVNINNELRTDIALKLSNDSVTFTLNGNRHLCGQVTLNIKGAKQYRYLYLYNNAKEKYELIQENNLDQLELTTHGQYIMTKYKLSYSDFPWHIVIMTSVCIVIASVAFICFRKRYWFW